MIAKITRLELKGEVEILKDREQVNWRFLHITDENGTIIEINKHLVCKLYQHMLDTKDPWVESYGIGDGVPK